MLFVKALLIPTLYLLTLLSIIPHAELIRVSFTTELLVRAVLTVLLEITDDLCRKTNSRWTFKLPLRTGGPEDKQHCGDSLIRRR